MKSGAGVNYTYDGDGRRAKKSSGKLYWYGLGAEPLLETNLSGGSEEEYMYFGGQRIARRVVSTSTVYYYFADHLSTSRVIVQANATTACYEADYTPYGKERVITDTCPQNYKFTGKERDSESTLDYFGARYYSWSFGRFHSPDLPFIDQRRTSPQSWNLYAYARNNPVNFTDSTGNAVDGPVGGSGLPGVHHGGGVSPSMLSGVTSHGWWYTVVTVVGGEIKLGMTTTTSANVQQTTQEQATPFHPKVTYDAGLSKQDRAVAEKNMGAAISLINEKWKDFTEEQRSIYSELRNIHIYPGFSGSGGGIDPKTLAFHIPFGDVKSASTPWLASAIGHDSFHVRQFFRTGFWFRGPEGLKQEVEATRFQISVGRVLGLSKAEMRYLQNVLKHPEKYWPEK